MLILCLHVLRQEAFSNARINVHVLQFSRFIGYYMKFSRVYYGQPYVNTIPPNVNDRRVLVLNVVSFHLKFDQNDSWRFMFIDIHASVILLMATLPQTQTICVHLTWVLLLRSWSQGLQQQQHPNLHFVSYNHWFVHEYSIVHMCTFCRAIDVNMNEHGRKPPDLKLK